MSTISEWDNEYARLARVASQVRSNSGGRHNNTIDPHVLHTQLQRLGDSLDQLTQLPPTEVQRRKRLVQHLLSQQQSGGSNNYDNNNVNNSSGGGQLQQSQMSVAMQQQDALIDELAVGMGRLKDQSGAIHDEAKLHVNLLTDMDTHLDEARTGLEVETRRAARLRADQSLWKLQLIVAALFIVFVLLLLMGLSP